jgi:hypothetical protein
MTCSQRDTTIPVHKRRPRIPRPSTRAGRRDYDLLQSLLSVRDATAELQAARVNGETRAADAAAAILAVGVPELVERFLDNWRHRTSDWHRKRRK